MPRKSSCKASNGVQTSRKQDDEDGNSHHSVTSHSSVLSQDTSNVDQADQVSNHQIIEQHKQHLEKKQQHLSRNKAKETTEQRQKCLERKRIVSKRRAVEKGLKASENAEEKRKLQQQKRRENRLKRILSALAEQHQQNLVTGRSLSIHKDKDCCGKYETTENNENSTHSKNKNGCINGSELKDIKIETEIESDDTQRTSNEENIFASAKEENGVKISIKEDDIGPTPISQSQNSETQIHDKNQCSQLYTLQFLLSKPARPPQVPDNLLNNIKPVVNQQKTTKRKVDENVEAYQRRIQKRRQRRANETVEQRKRRLEKQREYNLTKRRGKWADILSDKLRSKDHRIILSDAEGE